MDKRPIDIDGILNVWINPDDDRACDECHKSLPFTVMFGSPDDHSGLRLCFPCLENIFKSIIVYAALHAVNRGAT